VIPLTLAEVGTFAEGELLAADSAERIERIVADSREAGQGDLFVAVGRGREHVGEALARGASALVSDDPLAALAALAAAVRARSGARVVAITGSTGKTSTKDVLAALCRPHARTVASAGGHNNEVGVPLTLFRVEPDTELAIVEMGMRGLGQIAALCSVARPHVAVITTVGPVHLELLGTVERVAQAKAEVVASLPPGGVAVVPAGEPLLDPFLGRGDVELVRFGPGGDVRLEQFEPPVLAADVRGTRVELEVPFTARHQAANTLAALGAYAALGLPLDRAGEGAPSIAFAPWRGEERELPEGVLLIDDCYNANPPSMRAALAHLAERAAGRRTVAVLGDMAELGPGAPAFHREVGREAAAAGIQVLVAVGELARAYAEAAGESGVPLVRRVDSPEDAVAELEALLEPGDVVLVKGSRAMGLETVGESLGAKVGAR
jgi:UDP-N-acetylmuramoyl-tripeptide--D-alanyl-D-alanine ligase